MLASVPGRPAETGSTKTVGFDIRAVIPAVSTLLVTALVTVNATRTDPAVTLVMVTMVSLSPDCRESGSPATTWTLNASWNTVWAAVLKVE